MKNVSGSSGDKPSKPTESGKPGEVLKKFEQVTKGKEKKGDTQKEPSKIFNREGIIGKVLEKGHPKEDLSGKKIQDEKKEGVPLPVKIIGGNKGKQPKVEEPLPIKIVGDDGKQPKTGEVPKGLKEGILKEVKPRDVERGEGKEKEKISEKVREGKEVVQPIVPMQQMGLWEQQQVGPMQGIKQMGRIDVTVENLEKCAQMIDRLYVSDPDFKTGRSSVLIKFSEMNPNLKGAEVMITTNVEGKIELKFNGTRDTLNYISQNLDSLNNQFSSNTRDNIIIDIPREGREPGGQPGDSGSRQEYVPEEPTPEEESEK